MKRIRLAIAALLLFSIGFAVASPAFASADSPKATVCSTLGSGGDCGTTPNNSVDPNSVVRAVVSILSWIVGVASVVMIIISGLRMIIANGDSSKIASARNGIIYALVGLVVAVSAQAFVHLVLSRVS